MNKTLLVLIAVGIAAACCLGGGALLLLGADDQPPVSAEAPVAAPPAGGSTTLGSGRAVVGTWLLSFPTMKTWRSLRAGDALSTTSFTNGGSVMELHADGSCLRDSMFASNNFGCTIGAYTRYETCRWGLQGDVLTLELADGTIRSTSCDAKSETTKAANARSEQGRVALKVQGGTQYLTFTDLQTGNSVDFRRDPD